MKSEAMDLVRWQQRFGTEDGCIEALKQHCWSDGFQRPKCGHDLSTGLRPVSSTNADSAATGRR